MTVRKLVNNDWTFGGSIRDYVIGDDEINQNVITRLRSFKNDWFLDTEAHIDWINLLSSKGSEKRIKKEVYRVTAATEGVYRVDSIEIKTTNRQAKITLKYTTINSNQIDSELVI